MPSADPKEPKGSSEDGADEGISAAGEWLELSVAADVEAVEAVSEILSRVASAGTSVEPAFELTDEGLGARVDTSRPSIVRAYMPARDRSAVKAAIREADQALGHLQAFGLRPIGALETRIVHEADWANAWKKHFPVLRVGRRLVIRPTWRRHRRAPEDVVLSLDPGMAFGTGLHPTTRLCLAGLETWADEGVINPDAKTLDLGCGSGILAIAAALFGAKDVYACDVDPIAVEATEANAGRNRVARHIRSWRGSVPTPHGPYDLILANLIASLLVMLAEGMHGELRPGGRILASGIFIDREGDVRAAFEAAGLTVTRRWGEGDWVCLEAVRPA